MSENQDLIRVDLIGDLNIFNAGEQKQRLLEALNGGDTLEIDLSQVTEIDSAGAQLMLAAKREAEMRNKALRFVGHSAAVLAVLELCDIAGQLGAGQTTA